MPISINGLGVLSDDEYHAVAPKNLYDEMLSLPNGGRLFMGETPDAECLWMNQTLRLVEAADRGRSSLVTTDRFDVRVDLYCHNLEAAEGVMEYRIPLSDNEIARWDKNAWLDLADAVFFTFDALAKGERVLVNCQAGLNRSGLVTALALIAYGYSPENAIEQIRSKRSRICLANGSFEHFLLTRGAVFAKAAIDHPDDLPIPEPTP